MRRRALLQSFFVVMALVLVGCGRSGNASHSDAPDINEKALLDSVGFYQPVGVPVSLASSDVLDGLRHFQDADRGRLLSILWKAGYVGVVPNTAAQPWWAFTYRDGSYASPIFTASVATRVVASRSNERTWKEGPVQYYAETVEYSVQPTPSLAAIAHPQFPSGTLRLVAMNDPAVGKWQAVLGMERGTHYFANDAVAASQRLTALGGTYADGFIKSVVTAEIKADDTIESEIAAQGLLVHTADRHLIRSPLHHLIYFADPTYLTQSLTDVQRHCHSLNVGGYNGFRIPTQTEMAAVIDEQNGRFIDTPDRRFWGHAGIGYSDGSLTVLFATNTFTINFGNQAFSLDLDTLSGVEPYSYYYNMQTYRIPSTQVIARVAVPYDVAGNHPIAAHDYPDARWLVLCVAGDPQ